MKVNFKCKDNDVKLRFYCEDGEIDEVWVKIDGGFKDLLNGIDKANKKSKIKDSHDFGGGYIGEALNAL